MSSQVTPVVGNPVPSIDVEFGKRLRMACFYKSSGEAVVGFHLEQSGSGGKTKSVWNSAEETLWTYSQSQKLPQIEGYINRGKELLKAGFGVSKTKDYGWKNVIIKVDIPTVKPVATQATKTNTSVDDFLAALDGFSAE